MATTEKVAALHYEILQAARAERQTWPFPYDKVASVKSETGMRSGKLTIFTSGNKAELKDIHPKARATEIGDYVRARISASSSDEPEPTAKLRRQRPSTPWSS